MKKVLIIENHLQWFKLISKICTELQIPHFPSTEETFWNLSSDMSVSLKTGEIREDARKPREEKMLKYLSEFIAEEKNENIFCVIDNDLFEKKEKVNGMNFYELHLSGKPALFLPEDVYYRNYYRDVDWIKHLCSLTPGSSYIKKPSDPFYNNKYGLLEITAKITEKIKEFIER